MTLESESRVRMRRVTTAVIMLAACCMTLTGCEPVDTIMSYVGRETAESVADIATLGFVPDFSYEYEPQIPAVITDSVGYSLSGKKVIYIEGTDLAKDFEIISTRDDSSVYKGKLRKISADEQENKDAGSLYVGDFTEFAKEGTYRVFQENVGYSDEFVINNDSYSRLFEECYDKIEDAQYVKSDTLIYTLANLMFTKEIFGDEYTDDSFIKAGIEALISQQHPRLGVIYEELLDDDTLATISEELRNPASATINTEDMISLSATAEFAGVLAQYCYNYREEDPAFTAEVLRAAGKAYNYVERYREDVCADSLYYAAGELYRTTGQFKYRNAIVLYDNIAEEDRKKSDHDYTMLADVAYLSSAYKTDYVRCQSLMQYYRNKAAGISESATRQTFYVQSDIDKVDEDEILYNMMTLGLVSYVLSGREYAIVQSNYLHYLFGLNRDRVNYYLSPMREGGIPISEDIVQLSKMIFILGNGE